MKIPYCSYNLCHQLWILLLYFTRQPRRCKRWLLNKFSMEIKKLFHCNVKLISFQKKVLRCRGGIDQWDTLSWHDHYYYHCRYHGNGNGNISFQKKRIDAKEGVWPMRHSVLARSVITKEKRIEDLGRILMKDRSETWIHFWSIWWNISVIHLWPGKDLGKCSESESNLRIWSSLFGHNYHQPGIFATSAWMHVNCRHPS